MNNDNDKNKTEGTNDAPLYGWDFSNKLLQSIYKEPTINNYVEKAPQQSVVDPFALWHMITQPDAEIPYIPYLFNLRKDRYPQSDQNPPKQEVKTFSDGLSLSKDRFLNNMKYTKGYFQDKISVNKKERSEEALKHLPEYQQSSDAQLDAKVDSLEKVVEREPSTSTEDELKGLKEYQYLRKKGLSNKEIENKLSDLAKWGTSGKKRMEEAYNTNNELPEAKGAAILGSLAFDIGLNSLPTIMGAASLPAGLALGAGTVVSSMAESHAQAQMELDNYEKITGEIIPESQRWGFTTICVGSDLIFNSILQSRYLGNLKSTVRKQASKYFKNAILKHPTAQKEIMNLLADLENTEIRALFKSIKDGAILGGSTESLNSLTHDVATLIYRNPIHYPTLNEMMQNVGSSLLSGTFTGAFTGGFAQTFNHFNRTYNRRQEKQTAVLKTKTGIVEVIDYDPKKRVATIINPNGLGTSQRDRVNADDIKVISIKDFKENQRYIKMIEEPDPLYLVEYDADKEEVWKKASPLTKQKMIHDLAERIGIDNIVVYHHRADLPNIAKLKNFEPKIPEGSHYLYHGRVAFVLDELTSYNQLHNLLLYEAVSQQGLVALFGGNLDMYQSFLFDVYETMPMVCKVSEDTPVGRLFDATNYLVNIATSGQTTTKTQRLFSKLKYALRLYFPDLKLTDNDIKDMIRKSQEAVRDEYSWSSIWRSQVRTIPPPLFENDYIMHSIDPLTWKFLQENNPDWKGYKRFYDEVYGKEDGDDLPDIPDDLPDEE